MEILLIVLKYKLVFSTNLTIQIPMRIFFKSKKNKVLTLQLKEDVDYFLGLVLGFKLYTDNKHDFIFDEEIDYLIQDRTIGKYKDNRELIARLFAGVSYLSDDYFYLAYKQDTINVIYFYDPESLVKGFKMAEKILESDKTGKGLYMSLYYPPFNYEGDFLFIDEYPLPAKKTLFKKYNYITRKDLLEMQAIYKDRKDREKEDVSKPLPAKGFY